VTNRKVYKGVLAYNTNMVAQAVILDTCYVRHEPISLDYILEQEKAGASHYFVTAGILEELTAWEKSEGQVYDSETGKIDAVIAKIKKSASSKVYKRVLDMVQTYEQLTESDNPEFEKDQHITRILTEATRQWEGHRKRLRIDFRKRKGRYADYFRKLKEDYGEAITALDLQIEVYKDHAIITHQGVGNEAETHNIALAGNGDLDDNFLDYSVQIERHKFDKKKLDVTHKDLLRGRKIVHYFQMKPDRVIDAPTHEKIEGYGDFTAKSVARTVYQTKFHGKPLARTAINAFEEAVSAELVSKFSSQGYMNSDWAGLLAEAVKKTVGHASTKISESGGYIPDNNTENDANMVSVAWQFDAIKPDYESVALMTCDYDVATILELTRQVSTIPTNMEVECNLK